MTKSVIAIFVILGLITIVLGALVYSTNTKLNALEEEVKELSALKAEVKELRVLVPSNFAEIMPEYSERFHVLHFAGEAGDWGTANHELQSLKRTREMGEIIDPQMGELLLAFEKEYLDPLKHSIEDGHKGEFVELIERVPRGCNNCHIGTGSSFIKTTLEPPDTLSLRHSHTLEEQVVEEHGHTH